MLMLIVWMVLVALAGCSVPLPAESTSKPETAVSTQAESQAEAEPRAETAEHNVEALVQDAPLELGPDIDAETVASVINRDDIFLLDVREAWEHEAGHIVGNTLIPVGSVQNRLAEIPTDKTVIVYCHSGGRSARVSNFLRQQGYTNVHNMLGGIVAWQRAGFGVENE